MTEVLFYHLTESRLEEALPDLLQRSLARGWRVVVQCRSVERRDALDHVLWTFRDDSFLPHGTDAEDAAERQPILLTTRADQNGNAPDVRFMVDGATAQDLGRYTRAVYMFDASDEEQMLHARSRWTSEKAAGHALTYWQQADDRRWIKKA
ncbi:DNA polymerase III subunit chi [Fulvimarina sp. 2208YS6-2-32]|uniref:DNA polymerase III subunit chi n=1 Tax=Fulvimarina uroteuthidis TaxID=3098149 RepID=A0ABU5I6N3_9HYPH|nr:DNA polymerase III subunit chi [Fulvimarina sp. 2208YS6-2-32]MDY8110469.1 DNA polymerase III subunit chi [Fulvimarina sp. 2208YS6-2-32]